MRRNPHFDFSHLRAADRARLALDLWESLGDADREAASPMTPELVAEIDHRVAEMDAEADPGMPWDEVVAEVRREGQVGQRGA